MANLYFERAIYPEFLKACQNDLILILTGARQTGKTTFLKHIQEVLGGEEKSVFWVNLENPEFLDLLNHHPDNLFKITGLAPDSRQTIIVDEIQHLSNPTNFLKFIYDEYKEKTKLITSGSSSFYLDNRFKDSLAGRKRVFELYTLNFGEFLRFRGADELVKEPGRGANSGLLHKGEMDAVLTEYLLYGGYPSVVLEKDIRMKKELLAELALSHLRKDIFESHIQEQNKYYSILKMLANNAGSLLNQATLAGAAGLSLSSVERYVYVMQKSFQICLLRPFFRNVRKELTKMPKAYFFDLGLRNYFVNSFEPPVTRNDKGILFENAVARELVFRYGQENVKFWRTQNQNEVDFIINEKRALEVKFSGNDIKPSKYKLFAQNYPEIKLDFMTFDGLAAFLAGLN